MKLARKTSKKRLSRQTGQIVHRLPDSCTARISSSISKLIRINELNWPYDPISIGNLADLQILQAGFTNRELRFRTALTCRFLLLLPLPGLPARSCGCSAEFGISIAILTLEFQMCDKSPKHLMLFICCRPNFRRNQYLHR